MNRLDGTLEERLFGRLVPAADGCLEWPGQRDKNGYGMIWNGHGPRRTHRLAWELTNGAAPAGMQVLHRCDNPPCCNPEHLFLGTPKDNVVDMMAKGRDRFGWQRRKTHCKSGHEFTPENTRTDERGWRTCRTCKGWTGI